MRRVYLVAAGAPRCRPAVNQNSFDRTDAPRAKKPIISLRTAGDDQLSIKIVV